MSSTPSQAQLDSLFKSIKDFKISALSSKIIHLKINRVSKRNCFTAQTWKEYHTIITTLSKETDTRVIILSGEGNHFCSGIDVSELSNFAIPSPSSTEYYEKLKNLEHFQECISAPLRTHIPVIAVIHGICYGLGLDIIAASQIRLCTKDTRFSIKEIDVGIIADIGSLQRLPALVNNVSVLNELAFTGREFNGDDAKALGLTSAVFDTKAQALEYASILSETMKNKYWSALKGTKKCLDTMINDSKEVKDGLKQVASDNLQLMSDQEYLKFIRKRFKGLKL